jgi:DNA-binding CsgD family transcriptional regulator
MRPFGIGDVAAAACRDSFGCWGWIEAYRDSGDRPFDDDELELLASAGRSLASVLRRGLGGRIDGRAAAPLAPGVVVLGPDLNVRASTPQASAWFELLPAAPLFALWNMLPGTIYPVAALARSPESAEVAHALELGVDGRWVMIEAAPLEGSDQGEIAVVLRDARPPEIFDLLCRTYALTRRERDVAAAVLAGFDTRAISERLFISRHTVQDHLKSVFEKVGISSRRELVATFNA